MSLMDDDLFGLVFNNNILAAEVLLKTILKRDDIQIVSVEGQKFKELKESYVIFITENDYFKRGLPIYTINRHFEEFDGVFEDESHIIYVNGSYKGNDEIGHLMQDFRCKKADDIQNAELQKGVRYFKENKGGRRTMCESVERYADQKAIKTLIEAGIEFGVDKEKIVENLRKKFSLSEEQAERVYERYAPAVV